VRADVVERDVRPALDAGSVVVMERFVDSPLAHLSAVAGLEAEEFEGLADWATGKVRPDITVLLDADPGTSLTSDKRHAPGDQWRVQHLLAEMAAADPDRYVVVDADGTEDEIGERVKTAVRAVLVGRLSQLVPEEVAGGSA
jgi:dTMP kinase